MNIETINNIKMIAETAKEFAEKNKIICYNYECLKDAIKKSYEVAESGDTVLLSPASASWDQYDNFETRGKEFKETVWKLEG